MKDANAQLGKSSNTNPDATLKQLQTGLTRLGMAFPISTMDGKVAMGQGLSGKPTPITEHLIQAQEFLNAKRYDAAEEHLDEIDRLWPDFPGANYFRFAILQSKRQGYEKQAEQMADRVIPSLVDSIDSLKPLYAFSINQKLARGEKANAEQLFLKLVRNYPSDTNYVSAFVRIFGYTPSPKTQK